MPDGLRFALAIIFILLLMGILIGWMISQEMDKNPVEGLLEREYSLIYADKHFIQAVTPTYYPNIQTLGALAERIIHCESRGIHNVWGDLDYKYPAYGKWQFQERTFYWMADLAGYKGLNWKNEHHQDLVGMWALENGYESHWSCYRIVNK